VRQPPLPSMAIVSTSSRKVPAGVFALLLGGLGIHKFYLGQTGLGVVYLLFCWTLIPAIVGFVEGIIYLTMTDEDFARRYG
jgi:TM2 domain-containing membrane protein YozV